MSDVSGLTLAFIDRHPAVAARILAARPASEVSAFLASIPAPHACRLLTTLDARTASAVLARMDHDLAAAMIRDLGFSEAAAILRQMDATKRKGLLAALPARQRAQFEASLFFAPNTVGALMTTKINVLLTSDSCKTALELIKGDAGAASDVIFIHDQQRKFKGTIRLLSLLKRSDKTSLVDLADTSVVALSPHASVDQVSGLSAWDKDTTLPVVSRRGEVIGALPRRALTATDASPTADFAKPNSLVGEMIPAMTHAIGGFLDLVLKPTSPAQRQNKRPGDPHER